MNLESVSCSKESGLRKFINRIPLPRVEDFLAGGILFICVVVCQIVSLQFSPLWIEPYSGDLALYMNMGTHWFEGVRPYAEVIDTKGPALFELFALLEIMGLNNYVSVLFLVCVFWFIGAWYIKKLCLLFYSNFTALVLSVACISFMSVFGLGGSALSVERLILPLYIIPWYYFFKFYQSGKIMSRKVSLGIGALLSIFFWIKFSLVIGVLVPFVYWGYCAMRNLRTGNSILFRRMIQICASFTGVTLIIFVPLIFSGNLCSMLQHYGLAFFQNSGIGFDLKRFIKTITLYFFVQENYSLAVLVSGAVLVSSIGFAMSRSIDYKIKLLSVASYLFTGIVCSFYWPGATSLTFIYQLVWVFISSGSFYKQYFRSVRFRRRLFVVLSLGFCFSCLANIYDHNTSLVTVRFDQPIENNISVDQSFTVQSSNITPAYHYCYLSNQFEKESTLMLTDYETANHISYYGCIEPSTAYVYPTNLHYAQLIHDNSFRDILDENVLQQLSDGVYKQVLLDVNDLKNFQNNTWVKILYGYGFELKEIYRSTLPVYSNKGYQFRCLFAVRH